MQIINSSRLAIELREVDHAPGHWDAYLVPWPYGGERRFVDCCNSKAAAAAAAKAALPSPTSWRSGVEAARWP